MSRPPPARAMASASPVTILTVTPIFRAIEIADLYNLHDLTAEFPVNRLTAVAGPVTTATLSLSRLSMAAATSSTASTSACWSLSMPIWPC